MSKTTFTATAPSGKVFTRTTETMAYTHCLLVADKDDDNWGPWSWHLTHAAALKAQNARYHLENHKTKVVPVAVQEKPARKARKAAPKIDDAQLIEDMDGDGSDFEDTPARPQLAVVEQPDELSAARAELRAVAAGNGWTVATGQHGDTFTKGSHAVSTAYSSDGRRIRYAEAFEVGEHGYENAWKVFEGGRYIADENVNGQVRSILAARDEKAAEQVHKPAPVTFERDTLNGNTLVVVADDQGVTIRIRKGKHYQGIAKLGLGDGADLVKVLTEHLHG